MEYDTRAGGFRFHSLNFGKDGVGLESVTLDDPKCAQCHSQGRPIWDAMTGWPGFYGSIANTLGVFDENNPDALGFRGPGAQPDSHPTFKRAEWDAFNRLVWVEGGGYKQRPYFRHFDLGEVEGKANWHFVKAAVRNMELGSLLTRLQARQIVNELTREKGEQAADAIISSYLYLTSVAILPKGTTPSNATTTPFNQAGFDFERSIQAGKSRESELADMSRTVTQSQKAYAEDFVARQTEIFATVFKVGDKQEVEQLVRDFFKPLGSESAPAVAQNYARNLLFLKDHKINTNLLSTVALSSQAKATFDPSLLLVKPDSRGIFRIGSMGTVFDRICDAWLQERNKTGLCVSGASRGQKTP
jgi:hypothetical protein